VRIAALNALGTFIDFADARRNTQSNKNNNNNNNDKISSNVLKQVLPGISSSLGKIILGDWKAGTQIKTTALELWTKMVLCVTEDSNFPLLDLPLSPPSPTPSSTDSDIPSRVASSGSLEAFRTFLSGHNVQLNKGTGNVSESEKDKNKTGQMREEDKQWIHNAAAQLHKLVSLIFPSSFASSTQGFTGLTYIPPKAPFRTRLVLSAQALIQRCSRTLASCAPIFLETLLLHADDVDAEIAKLATNALSEVFASGHTAFGNVAGGESFWETLLEDNLHRIMKTLPRIITVASGDVNKVVPLQLVAGTSLSFSHSTLIIHYSLFV
jgi:hypothetical protein